MNVPRTLLCLFLLALLRTPAEAGEKPGEVIERAIKAHGGAEKLSQFTAEITRSRGIILLGGGLNFTQEVHLQLPDRIKDATILNVMGQELPVTLVFDGKNGWVRSNDMTKEMEDKLRTETLEGLHLARLSRIVSLKDKDLQIKELGPAKIEGRDAFGIQVACKGRRDVSLYFDKETGLLLKIARPAHDFETGKEVNEERIFLDYGEIDGLKLPRKFTITRDGKKFMDVEVTEARLPRKLEAEVFAKP
jgi:hypothetical protein